MGNFGGVYDVVDILFSRDVEGVSYPSTIDARVNDTLVFIDNVYATSGNTEALVNWYPTELTVTFGYPTAVYTWEKTLYGDNPTYPATPGITPTPTITPTATPTPVPELCGYWSLAVNTSNIIRNGYVQGTLTEIDPSDNFDVIDWYQVLPSGQEYLMYHYVYDPGLFGLGAGWLLVDPYTGTPTASSEAAAKQNTIQYTTSGGAHYLRVKIFDDKSLVPLAYHDYDLVCTLNQIVYVGETTQATSELGINLYESDTNAMIRGAEIHTQDKNSGEWQNKTSTYGGTVYFNVVPGNTYRILVDDSRWITYDQDYTVPSPPGILPIYLKRPLAEIENASYIHFYVRDASTYTAVMNAGITLSDGQAANTLSTGYAGFNVTDNALIYYTVSKSGYNSLTGSFQITEDTTLPVLIYPKVVTTTPTTLPYWTQTPTPLATYPNGTVIPGQTTQSTPYQTLDTAARAAALTEATDPWYRNASLISNLLLLALIMGIFTLMTSGIGGRRRKR